MAVLQIQIPMRSTEYRRRVESDFLEIKTDKGKIYFHSLRHGFTTFLVENGADIKTAQLRGQNQTCWNNVKCNETPISKHSTQQAAVGFEPTNNGFANRRLNNTSPFIKGTCGNSKNSCTRPLGYAAKHLSLNNLQKFIKKHFYYATTLTTTKWGL